VLGWTRRIRPRKQERIKIADCTLPLFSRTSANVRPFMLAS
jgi:hypothetical protein